MGMITLPASAIEHFKANLDEIFTTGALAEGKWNKAIARGVREYCDCTAAVPTSANGTGIVALLEILRVYYRRATVLIQSNTMYGVKTMAAASGLRLIRVIDCSAATLMPTASDVRAAIREAGAGDDSVIVLSHIGGTVNPDIVEIAEECRRHDVLLIEDCAHSFGATLNGRHSGTFGLAGVFSFYATKAVPAGEGGTVVTSDQALGSLVERYAIYDRFDQKMNIGVNIRLAEVQALLVYSVIREAEHIIASKREIANRYAEVCEKKGIAYVSQDTNGQRGNYYKFIILGNVADFQNIRTRTSPVYDYALGQSTDVCQSHLCLPIWYGQPIEVTEKVIEEIRSVRV